MKLREWTVLAEAEAGSTTSGTGTTESSSTPATDQGAGDPLDSQESAERALNNAEGDESTAEGSGEDWNELSQDDDAPAPAAKPVVAPKAEAPKAEAPLPDATKTTENQAPVTTPKEEPKVETPKVETPTLETPEAKAARELAERTANEARDKEQFDNLTKYYQLTDEMAEQLTTEPEKVLPVLAARLHQTMAASVQRMVMDYLPGLITAQMQTQQVETRARDAFFKEWPDLAQVEGIESKVAEVGLMFLKLNPKATSEQRIKGIGQLISQSLGIAAPAAANPAATQVPPAAPRRQAFTPSGTQSSNRGAPPASNNEFEEIAGQLLEEER